MSAATAPAWIGIDLGTQSVRVVALSDDGTTLAAASRPLHSVRDGVRHEQDPAEWWSEARDALREVTAALDRDATVAALAVSATSGTVVLLDATGRPVTPGLMYDDARATDHAARVQAAGDAVWSRLGYRMQGSWALPKLVWLRENGVLSNETRIAHQPDILTSQLAGRAVASDSSHALKSGVDLDSLTWPADVMAALDIPLAALPPIVAPGSVIGYVSIAAAADTGLPAGCAIVAGMTDGCAAQLSAGAIAPGAWNSVLGTTLVIKGMSRERHTDPTGAVYAHRAPFGEGWMPGGASSTGAGAVSHWLGGRDLTELTALAADLARVPVAYPLVGRGERFPFVAADAEAFFGGSLTPPPDDAALLSSIIHGVAYVERLSYDLLDLCGYDTAGDLSLTGGGSRNPWWNQLRCDLLQRPVLVPGRGEGAIGMALLAAAATDATAPASERLASAASRLLPDAARLDPDGGTARQLLSGYRAFLDELRRREWILPELFDHATGRIR